MNPFNASRSEPFRCKTAEFATEFSEPRHPSLRLTGLGLVVSAGLLFALSPSLKAQKTTPIVESEKSANEVIALNPFTVTADRDNGYQASTTLAGTRLKSDLKDIGASVSVITRDFLRDIGATDVASLLSYTTGTEVAGQLGNMSGSTSMSQGMANDSSNLNNPSPTTRLRGLAAATEARDFFSTSIPLDSYNVERIEINRGANSVLFGTGSPAGIINSSLRRADMKNRYEAEFHAGSYGSRRTSLDLNQQLIPGELSVRIDGLDRHTKYQQQFAFADDRRIYGTTTFAPKWARTPDGLLAGTIVKASFESGKQTSRRPRVLPPFDQITGWFQPWLGLYGSKLGWNASTMSVSQAIGGIGNAGAGQRSFYQPGMAVRGPIVFFSDPSSGTAGTGFSVNGTPIAGMPIISSNMTNPTGTHYLIAPPDLWSSVNNASGTAAVTGATFYSQPSITDRSIFDYRNALLEGPNRSEYGDFRVADVSLEQLFFRGRAGIELSLDRQDFSFGNSGLYFLNSISIDSNTVLLNGMPNPNFGRPWSSGGWTSAYTAKFNETRRATAFYRLDTADVVPGSLAKWLGTHTFSFLRQQERADLKAISGPRFTMPGYTFGNNQFITDASGGQMGVVTYLGPSLANANTAAGANIPGLTALQNPAAASGQSFQYRAQTAGSQFVVTPQTIIDNGLIPYESATGAALSRTRFYTSSGILQSKVLGGLVVATYGLRRDEVHTFNAPPPSQRGATNNLILTPGSWDLPTAPTGISAATTATKSVVVHAPEKLLSKVPLVSQLSLRYTTSENFNAGSTRYDPNLIEIAPPSGKTKDYGFSLGLWQNRINLSATWYETSQVDVTANAISGLCQVMIQNWVRLANFVNTNPGYSNSVTNNSPAALAQILPPPENLLKAYAYTVTNGSASSINRSDIVLTQDYVSSGKEFEAQINLTKNWRMSLNAAEQVAARSNTGAAFNEMFFKRKTNGQTLAENWTSPVAKTIATDVSGGTLAAITQTNIVNAFDTQVLQDGGPTQELRRWRFNAVTHYTFSRPGILKGIGLGSGLRWQSKVAIGYPLTRTPAGTLISDVLHPYYGPTELNIDSWLRYTRPFLRNKEISFEFRVFNLLKNDGLVPISTQPTGGIAAYRIPSTRTVDFSTRISF